jgi:L-amino acid N-acyltransferase YncA
MTIRCSTNADWSAIIEIYNQAVALGNATADTVPVTLESRRSWLESHNETKYPIYVFDCGGEVAGWCSISPYRAGREALRYTAEISYYVSESHRRQGVASGLVQHAIEACPKLSIKTLFGILLETNEASIGLLKRLRFEEWGRLPGVADFSGVECGHLYLGRRVE